MAQKTICMKYNWAVRGTVWGIVPHRGPCFQLNQLRQVFQTGQVRFVNMFSNWSGKIVNMVGQDLSTSF